MNTGGRGGGNSAAPSATWQGSHRAAGAGLLLVAALMTAWTVTGWAHIAHFNGAAARLFNGPAFADDDYASAHVEYSYAGTLLVADVLAVITVIIGCAVLGRWRRARPATTVLWVVLIAFSVNVFLLEFVSGIQVSETGISRELFRQSVRRFNDLTWWRQTSWFHFFTAATGPLTMVLIAASWYLLRTRRPGLEGSSPAE